MSQPEVVVPILATEKLTEPRVDVDAWEHPGLPHIRLDDSSVMRKGQEKAPAAAQSERMNESKYGRGRGGVGVTGVSMQLSDHSKNGANC